MRGSCLTAAAWLRSTSCLMAAAWPTPAFSAAAPISSAIRSWTMPFDAKRVAPHGREKSTRRAHADGCALDLGNPILDLAISSQPGGVLVAGLVARLDVGLDVAEADLGQLVDNALDRDAGLGRALLHQLQDPVLDVTICYQTGRVGGVGRCAPPLTRVTIATVGPLQAHLRPNEPPGRCVPCIPP